MAATDKHEHALTREALDRLTKWGRNRTIDGGENIHFSLSRQGAPSDPFLAFGDCSLFTPSGRRGTLTGQPVGNTGAPVAYFDNSGGALEILEQVPCSFSFDLNTGKVHLGGAFSNKLPPTLEFRVEYFKQFDGAAGENILFYSEPASDNAGYVIAMQRVRRSEGRNQVAYANGAGEERFAEGQLGGGAHHLGG